MCKGICLILSFFFQGGRQGLGSVNIAAHNGAVTSVNFPLVSFLDLLGQSHYFLKLAEVQS